MSPKEIHDILLGIAIYPILLIIFLLFLAIESRK
jgi:hypothetical protein